MLRTVSICATAALIVLIGGEALHAQDEYVTGMSGPHELNRGPGFNLAIWKLVFLLLIVWMWVKTTDWINRDSLEIGKNIGLPSEVWNPIAVFVFLVAFIAALLIPIFLAGYAVLVLAYFIPLFTYIGLRNGRVTQEQKVLTPDHIKRTIQNIGRGKKGPVVQKQPWELGPAVDMQAVGPVAAANQANMIEARQSTAYVPAKRLIADGLDNRAEKIMAWPEVDEISGHAMWPQLPLWACFGIVGGLLTAAGGIGFYSAVRQFQEFNPLPDESAQALKENVQWISRPR